MVLANNAAVHPDPPKLTTTLYAPLVDGPDVVNDGDTLEEPVVADMPGPLHVYTGAPAPPPIVAVRVITPPEQNGLLELEVIAVTDGCALIV